jgi:hypothetical protein
MATSFRVFQIPSHGRRNISVSCIKFSFRFSSLLSTCLQLVSPSKPSVFLRSLQMIPYTGFLLYEPVKGRRRRCAFWLGLPAFTNVLPVTLFETLSLWLPFVITMFLRWKQKMFPVHWISARNFRGDHYRRFCHQIL